MIAPSRVSLYSLDDEDDYLGYIPASLVMPKWMYSSLMKEGILHLSTKRVIFEPFDQKQTVFYLSLEDITDVDVTYASEAPSLGRLRIKQSPSPVCWNRVKTMRFVCAQYHTCLPNDQVSPLRKQRPGKGQDQWLFAPHTDVDAVDFVESVRATQEGQQRLAQSTEAWMRRVETALLQQGPRREGPQGDGGGGISGAVASFPAWRMFPLRQQRGVLHICTDAIVFDPLFPFTAKVMVRHAQLPARKLHGQATSVRFPAAEVDHVFPRSIAFHEVGLDFYVGTTSSTGLHESAAAAPRPALSFRFASEKERGHALLYMRRATSIRPFSVSFVAMQRCWQEGGMSNYQYLCFLNKMASRSHQDLAQYPVFPWILKDYKSPVINLGSDDVYRDLSRPIGALNPMRLRELKERQSALESVDEGSGLRAGGHYLYSTHYSSAGAVSYYLARSHPEYQLCFQHGSFDDPERMFESLAVAWDSVSTGASDFKELIPEFYDPEEARRLADRPPFSLGIKGLGVEVSPTLLLPTWAHESLERFATLLSDALESSYASRHLHLWIDLIFGYRQTGEEAVKADNTFHPYSYPPPFGSSPSSQDVRRRYAREFGCTPTKLFTTPHPPRFGETGTGLSAAPVLTTAASALSCDEAEGMAAEGSPSTMDTPPAERAGAESVGGGVIPPADAVDELISDSSLFAPSDVFTVTEVASVAATSASAAADLAAAHMPSLPVFPSNLMVLSNLAPSSSLDSPRSEGVVSVDGDRGGDGIGAGAAGRTLLTMVCDTDRRIVSLFDPLEGECLRRLTDFTSPVEMIATFGDYALIFTAGHDLFVVRLSICAVMEHIKYFSTALPVDWSRSHECLALGDTEGRVRVWCLADDDAIVRILCERAAALLDLESALSPLTKVSVRCEGSCVTALATTAAGELWWSRCQLPTESAPRKEEGAAPWRCFSFALLDGNAGAGAVETLALASADVDGSGCALVLRAHALQVYRLASGAMLAQWTARESHVGSFIGGVCLSDTNLLPLVVIGDAASSRVVVVSEAEECGQGLCVQALPRPVGFHLSLLCACNGLVASLNERGTVVLHYFESKW